VREECELHKFPKPTVAMGKVYGLPCPPEDPQSVYSWTGRTISPRLGRFPHCHDPWALPRRAG